MMRPLAAGRGLWRGCGISNLVAYCWSLRTVLQPLNLTLDLEHAHVSGYSTVMQGIRKRAERRSRAFRLQDLQRRTPEGIVNLSGRGMLLVSVTRQLGSGNSFACLLWYPLKPSGTGKGALGPRS